MGATKGQKRIKNISNLFYTSSYETETYLNEYVNNANNFNSIYDPPTISKSDNIFDSYSSISIVFNNANDILGRGITILDTRSNDLRNANQRN